jgi:hypothetical protein
MALCLYGNGLGRHCVYGYGYGTIAWEGEMVSGGYGYGLGWQGGTIAMTFVLFPMSYVLCARR